jgi:hypothetical protein
MSQARYLTKPKPPAENEVDRLAIEKLECPHCLAKPGDKCVTAKGAFARDVHMQRWLNSRSEFFEYKPGYGYERKAGLVP